MGHCLLSYIRMNETQPQRRSKEIRATDTKDRLLAAAREVVAERGVAGTTSRQITDAAGVNLASITYHFGSKDELVSAALLDEIERLVEPALRALEGDGDPAGRMLETVQLLLQTFAAERDRAPVYFEAVATELRGPRESTSLLMARIRERLASVIESLQADDTVPAWVDPNAMSALILATAQGLVLQSALDPRGPKPDEQASQFAGLLLAARN